MQLFTPKCYQWMVDPVTHEPGHCMDHPGHRDTNIHFEVVHSCVYQIPWRIHRSVLMMERCNWALFARSTLIPFKCISKGIELKPGSLKSAITWVYLNTDRYVLMFSCWWLWTGAEGAMEFHEQLEYKLMQIFTPRCHQWMVDPVMHEPGDKSIHKKFVFTRACTPCTSRVGNWILITQDTGDTNIHYKVVHLAHVSIDTTENT